MFDEEYVRAPLPSLSDKRCNDCGESARPALAYAAWTASLVSVSSFLISGTQEPQLPPAFRQAVTCATLSRLRSRMASQMVLLPTP